MKITKYAVIAVLLMATQFSWAKDIKVVIKTTGTKPIGGTEVFIGKDNEVDTVTVVPGNNVTNLIVSLKGLDGETLSSYFLPVDTPDVFNIITPHMPEGFLLEIKDNNGVIYTGVEEEE